MKKKYLVGSFLLATFLLTSGINSADAAMSYEKALQYEQAHSEEVHSFTDKQKDIYGEKNKRRFIGLFGKNGLLHTGNTFAGSAQRTFFNYLIDYGFANIPMEPYAYIRWAADLAGRPDKGYEPKTLQIVFEDNHIQQFSLEGWEYRSEYIAGFFGGSTAHNYNGRIKLNRFEIYEMSLHGKIVSASMDAGDGTIKHFFYSGDKDADKKVLLTKGIKHSMKILEIDPAAMPAEYEAYKKQLEEQRLAKLRAEVEKEIKAEQEKEALKKQILEEMKLKEQNKAVTKYIKAPLCGSFYFL